MHSAEQTKNRAFSPLTWFAPQDKGSRGFYPPTERCRRYGPPSLWHPGGGRKPRILRFSADPRVVCAYSAQAGRCRCLIPAMASASRACRVSGYPRPRRDETGHALTPLTGGRLPEGFSQSGHGFLPAPPGTQQRLFLFRLLSFRNWNRYLAHGATRCAPRRLAADLA